MRPVRPSVAAISRNSRGLVASRVSAIHTSLEVDRHHPPPPLSAPFDSLALRRTALSPNPPPISSSTRPILVFGATLPRRATMLSRSPRAQALSKSHPRPPVPKTSWQARQSPKNNVAARGRSPSASLQPSRVFAAFTAEADGGGTSVVSARVWDIINVR